MCNGIICENFPEAVETVETYGGVFKGKNIKDGGKAIPVPSIADNSKFWIPKIYAKRYGSFDVRDVKIIYFAECNNDCYFYVEKLTGDFNASNRGLLKQA